jgi:diketogulonate reductase-like aldo/keto reductase
MGMGRRICTETVDKMLEVGFTSIDTAPTYNNEDKIGESAMLRQYPFTIIAKVPKRAVQSNNVRTELEQSLKKLNKEKISLLLLHWPSDVIAAGTLKQVWTTMEELLKEGNCMALGVCNFNPAALATLLSVCTIPPVVNQVERHPLLSQLELIDYCARHNIYIQAHTPLGGGRDELLNHPTVIQIAKDINRSPAQVLIQWNIQQGMAVVCKCSSESHGKELLACAVDPTVKNRKRLSPDHMKALDGMNDGTRFVAPPFMYGTGDVYCWGDHMPGKNA